MSGCCSPSHRSGDDAGYRPAAAVAADGVVGEMADAEPVASSRPLGHHEIALAGGRFTMGDACGEGYRQDGEVPAHPVVVGPFRIDAHQVTNDQFARFVGATGYRTEAETFGTSAVFHLVVAANEADQLGRAGPAPWWVEVRGAYWAQPFGPRSDLDGLGRHPVVHVSWNDASAYARWVGRRLPTEAEWEYAARGGLPRARYPWGNDLTGPGSDHRCNIWQGDFPTVNTGDDGYEATSPVGTYPPNGFGLADMAGNVWDWCADWFSPHTYAREGHGGRSVVDPTGPAVGSARVMRGGSYLCHASYCNRYRVAARSFNTPESSSGNCGFRTVAVETNPPPPPSTPGSIGLGGDR